MFRYAALFFHYLPLNFPIFVFRRAVAALLLLLFCIGCRLFPTLPVSFTFQFVSCAFFPFGFFLKSFFVSLFSLYWNEMKCLPNQRMPKAKDNDRFVWFLKHFTNNGLVCIANCRLPMHYTLVSLRLLLFYVHNSTYAHKHHTAQ